MIRYRITAYCNLPGAKGRRPRGAKVLRREGSRPVKWVYDDNYGRGFESRDEAREHMEFLINFTNIKAVWYDAKDKSCAPPQETHFVVRVTREGKQPPVELIEDPIWYMGPGWYTTDNRLIHLKEGNLMFIDGMVYEIDEYYNMSYDLNGRYVGKA